MLTVLFLKWVWDYLRMQKHIILTYMVAKNLILKSEEQTKHDKFRLT